ncbi:MAG: methionine synthase [Fervidicoccaceae archaeon]
MELPILPTTVVGSYPRPAWLKRMLKLRRYGKVDEDQLLEALDDAVVAAVREQELAGIDIPSDGEQRRDEMVEYFAERIGGFKFYGPVRVWNNNFFNKPAVVSKLEYKQPIVLEEYFYLKRISTRPIVKVTITGPYTIADWSFNEYYETKEELVRELSKIIKAEISALADHGAVFIQIDEPALTTHPNEVEWAIELIDEMANGVNAKIALHVCYSDYNLLTPHVDRLKNISQLVLEFANRGFRDLAMLRGFSKELGFGVVDVHSKRVEEPEEIARALRKAMEYVPPDMIYVNPDCGLKLLPRRVARAKLESMVAGVSLVRAELRARGLETVPLRLRV